MKNRTLHALASLRRQARFARARRLAAALVSVVAGMWCTSCSPKAGDSAPSAEVSAGSVKLSAAQRQNVQFYTVEPGKFRNTVEVTGVVDFDNDQATSVLAPFSGPVSKLLVSPGERVKAGDALALVDSPDFATAISTYRKAIATARTDRRLADLEKDLVEHQGVAQREQEQAETDAANAEADRDAALRALVSLQVPPETIRDIQEGRPVSHPGAIIRSPIAGTVVQKLITPGQLLQAGTTPCFTVADLSRVWIMAQLFGSDLASVSLGDPAQVMTGVDSNTLTGKVDNVSALVDPDTRAVAVRVVADNPAGILRKQMYVRVLIQARQESTGLLVPVAAILRDDENLPFVYLARSDGSVARQHVTLGARTDDRYDVVAGLHAGDQIVVAGGIFVQFMQSQ